MNRPNMYIAQLTAQAAWLRAQGDDEGAVLAEELADRFNTRHEGVLDATAPEWASGPDVEIDTAPNIRCSPEVGVIFPNHAGEPILTIDMLDGGDVAVVHLGDVLAWHAGMVKAVDGLIADGAAQAELDRARQAHDATVGEGDAIDASFEVTEDEEPATPYGSGSPWRHPSEATSELGYDDGTGAEDGDPYTEAVAGDEIGPTDERMDARELDAQDFETSDWQASGGGLGGGD